MSTHWPGLVFVVGLPTAVVVAFSYLISPWLLLVLLVGLPPFNNLHRFLGGLLQPFLFAKQQMDIILGPSLSVVV